MGKKGKYNNQKNEEEEPKKKKLMITEEHLMDKTHMDSTNFLAMLAQDSYYPPYAITSTEVIKNILKDLNYLLYLDFKNFWATVLYNPSLKICLCSCLQYLHRNWLNQYVIKQIPKESIYDEVKFKPQFQYTQSLMKVLLIIYWRIVHVREENEELNKLYKLDEEIFNKFIIDTPRLLELTEIYGGSNPEIVKIIVKTVNKLNPQFYKIFVEDVMDNILEKMNRDLIVIKRISDREEFGIEYSYKRTVNNELSPGEEELRRKIHLLMELVSFYQTINRVEQFFPESCSEYTRFNVSIHNLSENIFIEIEQAYKTWNDHGQASRMYPLMDTILENIKDYFVDFLERCDKIFVQKNQKTNAIGSYLKCLDRMFESYGRRVSLGKKASSSKRYLDLYNEILKDFPLDEFLTKLYVDQIQNGTHEMNIEYLVDFKLAIDELVIKNNGNPNLNVQFDNFENQTEADEQVPDDKENEEIQIIRKYSCASNKEIVVNKVDDDMAALETMISKRDREENYYEKLYKNYRTKITVEYDDDYDDLVDYEKRPMFEDNQIESEDSSDADFDSEEEKLHLVKSQSNVSRNRAHLTENENTKYNRKNKVTYVAANKNEIRSILNKEGKEETKQKHYTEKKQEKQYKAKEYEDEQCLQECKAKKPTENEEGNKNKQKPFYKNKEKNPQKNPKPKYIAKQ